MLSQHNGWFDDRGRVYIIYDNASLMQALNRGLSIIKSAVRELEELGLLERQAVPGRANRLYVSLPAGQASDPVKKPTSSRAINRPRVGQLPDPGEGEYLPLNNMTIMTEQNETTLSDAPKAHGRYRNLYFTADELAHLREDCPLDLERYIEELSTYMTANNRSYSNHAPLFECGLLVTARLTSLG